MDFGASHLKLILLFVLIPLIIYLLFRRRYRKQELGTMLLLMRAYRKVRKLLRIKEMILLALRTTALFIFLFALLQPLLTGLTKHKERFIALVFDTSLSMRTRLGDMDRFERARNFARDMISGEGDTSRVQLFTFSDTTAKLSSGPLQVGEALRVLQAQTAGYGPTKPFPMLNPLLEEVRKAKAGGSRCLVYIFSDMALNAWTESGKLQNPLDLVKLQELGEISELSIVDCSNGHRKNKAVTNLNPSRGTFCVGLDTLITARTANYAQSSEDAVTVSLYRDGEAFGQRASDITSGEEVDSSFPDRPMDEGPHFYKATIEPDELAEDNERHLAVDVRRKIEVLLIDGRPNTDRFQSASGFTDTALAPSDLRDLSPISPKIITLADLETEDITFPGVVMLLDPPSLSKRASDLLRKHVAGGGGLFVVCGPSVRVESINEALAGNDPLLPATLIMSHTGANEGWLGVERLNLPEPLEGMGALWRSGMKRLKIFSYVEAKPHDDTDILLTLAGGKALLATRRYGLGKVVLWTSSFDGEWTNLPALPMFPPLLHELVLYLSETGHDNLNLIVGERMSIPLAAADTGGAATLYTPSGDELELRPVLDKGTARIQYGPIDLPGLYRLQLSSERQLFIAVNSPYEESDLAPVSEKVLRTVLDGVSYNYVPIMSPNSGILLEKPLDLQSYLLFAALLLLLLETLLASLFSAPPKSVKFDLMPGVYNK